MTELSGPFDNAAWGEDGWSHAARLFSVSGVEAKYDNELLVSIVSGMQTQMGLGNAWVHGFAYRNQDAPKTFTHASSAGPAGQTRYDLIVLHLDRAANTIDARVIQGVFSATPTDPALTQNNASQIWEIPIARVPVVANASAVSAPVMLRELINRGMPRLSGVKRSSAATVATADERADGGVGTIQVIVTDARHQYRVHYKAVCNTDTSVDTLMNLLIRDSGSASAPNVNSTRLATGTQVVSVAGAPGQRDAIAEDIIQFSVGTHTIGAFYARIGGSANVTVAGFRTLSVENLGFVNPQ